jgi:aryl-alcohol dehydrogenase-like predicted oxidoreductase
MMPADTTRRAEDTITAAHNDVPSIRFKESDLIASRIGFGCAAIGGYDYGEVSDDDSRQAIRAAFDAGVTLFDTADVYGFGRAEKVLAEALGAHRHDVIIATKGGVNWDTAGRTSRDLSATHLVSALEASLTRLRLDCIPLYQLHWPDPKVPLEDAIETLLRAREQGKIKHIGVCNIPAPELVDLGVLDYIHSVQVPYSLLERAHDETMQICADSSILALCYNVLGQGLLTGKITRESQFRGTDLRLRSALFREPKFNHGLSVLGLISEIAKRQNARPSQVAIRWVIDRWHTTIALTGIKNPAQIVENIGASHVVLSEHDAARLEKLSNDF